MTCSRCKSLMLLQYPLHYYCQSLDTSDPTSHRAAYRCPCCGNYEDPTIMANRRMQVVLS
jgi:Zn finger protein HypA/HybF involved in hydrogenase expression